MLGLKNISILIVEDDPATVILLKEILDSINTTIYDVTDGQSAVDFCKTNDIDLVLMDIALPIMDGIEAVKQIKKLKPKLPIIAETVYATPEEVDDLKKAGFDAYILKPYTGEEILKLIEEVLVKKN